MEHIPSRLERDRQWGIVCTAVGKTSYEGANLVQNGEYRLIYITSGSGAFTSASCQKRVINEGDVILVFPDGPFCIEPAPESRLESTWVSFWADEGISKNISSFFDKSAPIMRIGSSDTVFDLYGRLNYLAKTEKPGSQEAMGGFIYALLGYVYHKASSLSISKSGNVDKIQEAQMMLRSDLSSHISPASIARSLGMSYSLLREQFKSVTGVSMSGYQLIQRINRAKTLLLSTDKSIKEIAYETGYESMTRFCCAFKKAVGIPATEFRSHNSK